MGEMTMKLAPFGYLEVRTSSVQYIYFRQDLGICGCVGDSPFLILSGAWDFGTSHLQVLYYLNYSSHKFGKSYNHL